MFIISADPHEVPTRTSGDKFPYVFVAPTGAAIFADTLTEVVDQIIAGYNDLNDHAVGDEYFEARVSSLAQFAGTQQAELLASADEADFAKLTDSAITALLSPKDGISVDLGEPGWVSDIPLLLLTTDYAPYSTAECPAGAAVVWLDPVTELTYLNSLQRLGIGELHAAE